MVENLFLGEGLSGLRDDESLDGFTGPLVRNAYHRDLCHLRVARDGVLDLLWEDVEPRNDDEVLGAIDDEQVPVLIPVGDVTRPQPVSAEGCRAFILALPVTLEDV